LLVSNFGAFVDLREVTYMDSSELAVLLRQKAQMNGGERVRQLLGPTRLKTATSPSPTRSTVARASKLKMSK
jgi:hypothetical protein